MKFSCRFPSVSIQKKFEKVLSRIPNKKIREEIMDAIFKLQDYPRPFGQKLFKQLAPPIECYEFTAQYRLRVGDYRILYDVNDERKIVWILALRKCGETTYN